MSYKGWIIIDIYIYIMEVGMGSIRLGNVTKGTFSIFLGKVNGRLDIERLFDVFLLVGQSYNREM